MKRIVEEIKLLGKDWVETIWAEAKEFPADIIQGDIAGTRVR